MKAYECECGASFRSEEEYRVHKVACDKYASLDGPVVQEGQGGAGARKRASKRERVPREGERAPPQKDVSRRGQAKRKSKGRFRV